MNKTLKIQVGQYSCKGKKSLNQDFHGAFTPPEPQLSRKGVAIAIADGISSSNVSQVASETAVKGFLQDYFCTPDSWSVKTAALKVLTAMNSWLYAQTRQGPFRYNKDKGYICTFSALILKSNTGHIFHCGDSRIFLIRQDQIEQLTSDHINAISQEEQYLTRALGIHDAIELEYKSIPLQEGDQFILATDGVYEHISHQQLINYTDTRSDQLDNVAKKIVNTALESGSQDNLTLQILQIQELPDRQLNELHQQIDNLLPAPRLEARMQFDGYTILRDIYISSRSHVFLALENASQKKAVIKIASTELSNNEDYLENLLMEDWIARRINNNHVLKSINTTKPKKYIYTATEYIEGRTLTQWMIDNPSPTIDSVRNIVKQIAKGLQAFHRKEMIHQDLRPKNIMIDAAGTVKIIDFGSTRVAGLSDIKSKNEGIVGTAQYAAPEYFIGSIGSAQSDIFSLGVITYQLLSRDLPYGTTISKTRSAREQSRLTYKSLSNHHPNIPGWIDFAIQKATKIEPHKRYVEVSEFIEDLTRPNATYVSKTHRPLIEKNPILFWQCVSLILFSLLIYQSIR